MVGVRKYPRARLTELCFGILASFAFPADADQFHFGTERALAPGAISWDAIDPSRPVQCSLSVQPSVATDNDRLLLIDLMSASRDTPVLLRGVRYNGFGPQAEPEQIYCGCQHVSMNFVGDGEGGGSLVPGIRVPMDAPSGHYSVEILPSGSTCGSGGIRASCQAPAPCVSPTLTVVPSHVVAVMKALKITDNGEDNDINPAEMQFYFAGVSGALVGEERLVNWSGGFPAGPTNASHLTNDDHTVLSATVPLFSGRESLMSAAECREECVAAAASEEQQCTAVCASNESLGRYDDKLEFGISGFESDSSPSKAWGFLAGVAASAASCYLFQSAGGDCTSFAGVTTSGGIGAAVAAGLNKYLTDDDDKFGSASSVMQHNTNDWGIGVTFPPVQFVDGSGGDVAVDFEMRRIAAPSLIHYSVRLKSITLYEGYELGGCPPPNEIFIHSRASFQVGQVDQSEPIRIPAGSDVLSLDEGETRVLNANIFSSDNLLPENVAEVPFLYLETSVWERDAENDLIGFDADLIELAPVVARFDDFDTTVDGFLVRPGTVTVTQVFEGFGGSDDHCSLIAAGVSGSQGHAQIQFEISLSWLPFPPLR